MMKPTLPRVGILVLLHKPAIRRFFIPICSKKVRVRDRLSLPFSDIFSARRADRVIFWEGWSRLKIRMSPTDFSLTRSKKTFLSWKLLIWQFFLSWKEFEPLIGQRIVSVSNHPYFIQQPHQECTKYGEGQNPALSTHQWDALMFEPNPIASGVPMRYTILVQLGPINV